MDTKVLVLLAFVATTALAGPISNQEYYQTCSSQCTDSNKFRYAPGSTYTYEYRVDTATSMAGASEDTARLTLQTIGDVQVLSPCEFSLQLRSTRLFHTDGNGNLKTADREVQFRSGMEAYPLRFSFQDGKVEHVCKSDDDAWILNLKKGFLSSFQNSMDDLTHSQNVTETDVAGTCKTEYTVLSNGYYTTSVKKTKDILSCTDRHNFESIIQSTPYLIPSDIQSLPLMKTTHECEQSIEVGVVLKSTVCSETHMYRPFANGQSGGSTTVSQKLTYKTNTRTVTQTAGSIGSRDTLIFDHTVSQSTREQARRSVEQKLGAICDNTMYDIRPESPRLFSELVLAMKSMGTDDMENLYRLLKTKTLCPSNNRAYQFFLDALPMTNTRSSVRLMSKLIANADVEGLTAKAWLASLAFISKPTSEMILDVKSLVDSRKVRDDALLPVSSLINNYCRQKDSCERDNAVLSIMASIERIIGYRCDASGKKFDKILLTLRAIGNAGHSPSSIKALEKCMSATSNPIEIRIAAIEAFRRMPCNVEDKNVWALLMDRTLDSELRISAYMALMRCPCHKTVEKMAALLVDEDNEQVSAFVYSHLTNLRESSNPHKQEAARLVKDLSLDKEFDLSPLKFSRNYEISTLINKLNTGFTAESNMIWSSTDQLPRSISGNLTVELFGQSINIFDFGGRLEGLEYLLRNVLGPYVNANEKTEKQLDFDKIQGSIFGRVFGNEMLFVHSKTASSPFGKLPSKWLDVFIKLAKKQEFAFTQNFQFIDANLVIPTSAGLPVHMHINGSATVDLSLSGKMDLRKVAASPRSMDVDGQVKPSAALVVSGTMAVDAFVTKTGLRMRNTMHTSTSLKGRIQMNRGQQLNIELDTPEDKQEIFGAKSQFFILHNDIEQEQEMIKENRKDYEMCSGESMATITGLELCGQLSFPNASLQSEGPYFPLTGPSAVSVILFKKDTHSGYKLFAKRIQNKKANIAQFSVNTPGSRVDRAITLELTLNHAKQMVEANMFSPWKKVEMRGDVINQNGMKSVTGRLVVDETHVYALSSELKTVQEKGKVQYSPMIEIKRPGASKVHLYGLIALVQPMKSLEVDLTLAGLRKTPLTMKSTIVNTKKDKSLSASFSTDNKNVYSIEASNQFSMTSKKAIAASLKTKLDINNPTKKLVSITGSGEYRENKLLKTYTTVSIHRLLKKPATLQVTLEKNAKKKGSRYDLDVSLKSSHITARIDSNLFTKPSGFLSTRASLDYSIPKLNKNKIVFAGKVNDKSTKAYKKVSAKGNLNVKRNPEYNMGVAFELDHKKKHSEVELDVNYGPNPKDRTKKIYILTSLTKRITNYKNALVNYKIKAQAPEHNVDIFLGGKHVHNPKMLDSNVQLRYSKDRNINAGITLKDQSTKLTKLNGKVNVEWPGVEYSANTLLVQRSAKQYAHELNIKSNDGTKHSITTVYKMPKANSHDIRTELNLHGMTPLTLTGSTTLNLRNFAASVKAMSDQDTYGFITASKFTKSPNGKVNIEVIHPARRMTLDVNGGKIKNKYEGSVEASWDADKKDSKVVLDGAYFQKTFKGAVSLGGNLNFRSPFTSFEDLLASFKYGSDPTEHNIDSKFSWGGKGKQIVANMNCKKDFNLRNIDITAGLKTPFESFRSSEISVNHNLRNSLNTVIKGNVEKENVKLVVQGKDQSDNYKTDVKGNLAFKSSLNNAKIITATFSHTLNNGKLVSSADVNHNGQKYEVDVNMAHNANGWNIKNSGDVTVKAPKTKVSSKWTHMTTDNTMKSFFVSAWDKNTLRVDFTGSHELSDLRRLNADLRIKSPWTIARNVEISLDHKHGNGLVKSNAFLNQNGKTKMSSKVNLKSDKSSSTIAFELKTPVTENFIGKLNAQYERYPMTSSAELTWAPRKKVTLEGSLNIASWDKADTNLKLTTPSRKYSNILFTASNRRDNGEIVSQMVLDYGVRQSIDIQSRMAYNDQKKFARVKLMSPFDNIKSLETGLSFDGSLYNFDSRADFEMLPKIGKFETLVNWQYQNDMNGKIRVNTPFQDYPYFELSTSTLKKSDSRQSRVQLEYSPSKVISLATTYKFELPLSFAATIRSPYPEYDNLGVSVLHNHADSFIRTHGEIKYKPDATIQGDLNADWSSDIAGSLTVKTPFENFESNQISFSHRQSRQLFSTHGEMFLAQKEVVVDASLKTGYTTTGALTITSPVPALENIKVTLKKRGTIDNLKGGMVFSINKERAMVNFLNKLTGSSIKSGFSISTPYTETLKLSLEHNGLVKSFTNEMSFNYGRKIDIDTVASFNLRRQSVDGNALLKYKLGKGRNTIKLNFKKSGTIEDVSITGLASFNKDDISISGSLKTAGEIDCSLIIKTPFENFRTTGMTLSHKGNMNYFQSDANINYMDGKTIFGKIELSNQNGEKIRFLSQITTPFKNLKTSSFEFNNEINDASNHISGNVVLTTTLNKFGSGNIVYSKAGNLNNLVIDTSVSKNGKDLAVLKLTNNVQENELHSKFDLESIAAPNVMFSIDHSGDLESFNTKSTATVGMNTLSGEANLRRGYQSFDADSLIRYQSGNRAEKKFSVNVHTDGSWDRYNLRIGGILNDDEVKLLASKQGLLQDMSFNGKASYNGQSIDVDGSWRNKGDIEGKIDVQTPFKNFNDVGMSVSHSGDASKFTSSATIKYMDDKKINGNVKLTAYSLEQIQLNVYLSTPFENYRYADVKFNNNYNRYSTDISGNVALSTPIANLGTKTVKYSKTGNLNNLEIDVTSTDNGLKATSLKISNNLYGNEIHSVIDLKSSNVPDVLMTLDHSGDLSNLETIAKGQFGQKNVVTGEIKVNVRDEVFDGQGKFMYNIAAVGQKEGSLKIHQEGQLDDVNFEITGKLGNQMTKVSGNFKNKDDLDVAMTLNTPVENFRHVGLSFRHSGNLDKFNCDGRIELMDDKVFTGKIDFFRDLFRRIETTVEVTTPLKDFEFTKFEHSHEGDKNSLKCSSNLQYGISKKIAFDVTASSLQLADDTWNPKLSAELSTPFTDFKSIKYEQSHIIGKNTLKATHKLINANGKTIVFEATQTMKAKREITVSLQTPFESYENMMGYVTFDISGPTYDITSRINAGSNLIYSLTGSIDVSQDISGALKIATPHERFTNIGMDFLHTVRDEKFSTEGKVTYMDGKTISGKTNLDLPQKGRNQIEAELRTPFSGFEFTKYEQSLMIDKKAFISKHKLIYGDSQTFAFEATHTKKPKREITVSLKTPFESYEDMMVYVTFDIGGLKNDITSRISAGSNRIYSLTGSIDVSRDISGALKIATPYEGFTNIHLDFLHSGSDERFSTEGQVTYMDGKTISGKTELNLPKKGRIEFAAELRTPFAGYRFTRYEHSYILNRKVLKSIIKIVYGDAKTIVYEVIRRLKPNQELTISLKTPFENYEELMAYLSFDNNAPKYGLNSKINIGHNNIYSLTGLFDNSGDISGALNIATPIEGFTDIGMDFLHSGDGDKFSSEGKVTYMDGKEISGKLNFYKYLWRRIVASTELSTPFNGLENTKAEVNFEDNSNSISTTAAVEYGAGNKFNGNLKLTYTPNYDVMITLNTPFNDYKTMRAQGSLDMTAPAYEITYNLDNGNNQIYSAIGKVNLYSLDNIDASLEMNTPLTGYEYTKAEYSHKMDASEIDGSLSLLYKNGQKLSGELKTSLSPNFDTTLTLKTPFSGFENIQGTVAFEQSLRRYETSSTLNLGRGQIYSMSSDIDYSSFPVRAYAKVNTPCTDFRNMELTLTHDGELNSFVSTGLFRSSLTDDINAQASLNYLSIFDMEARASLQSPLSGFDDLKAEVKMSNVKDERKAHLLMGWASGQEMTIDGTYKNQKSWYENKVNADLSVSTPFPAVRSLAWQAEASDLENVLNEKMNLELNGDSLLDIDYDLKLKDKPEVQISLRKPWPMLYTLTWSLYDGESAEADLFLNWNRDETNSNIRFQTTWNDKSNDYQTENNLDLRVTHPSRQVGVIHKMTIDTAQLSSGGQIFWNAGDSSKVSYDLQINENSRRRKQIIDGTFKLGMPTRTLGLVGSFSNNKVTKVADATFSWDMDRDESQRVGVKATMNRGDSIKGDISLSLPSLRKEIRVDGEVMLKNGRIILDTKTDFSYSKDSRKTLTLTSKLTDVSDYYSNFNYSLSLGVSHPYTNLDVEINSHIGNSDERTTFGMNTNYLTAKRQIKNLALLTEINQLKKQMNLQVSSPLNKIEIAGDVFSTSPYKVRMINKINDIETFRSDVTVDQNRKSFILNAFTNTDSVTVSANYPNNSAFQADVNHHSLYAEHRDALLAVRLNTSRLLHTRLSWRPELMEELRVNMLEKAIENALNAKAVLSEINEALSDELSAKYAAITTEVTRELRPFIAKLNEDLASIAVMLGELSSELRTMYERNDFYIQDMGEEINVFYMKLQETLVKLTDDYRDNYQQLIRSMTKSLRDMRRYNIGEEYTKMVEENAKWINQQIDQSMTWIESTLNELDKTLQQYKDQVAQTKQRALDTVYNATYVNYLSNKIGQIHNSINLKPYISSFKLPEEYTNAIYDVHNTLYTNVNEYLDRSQARYLKESVNEVYQQGKWAYHYWQLEENIRKHSHSILQSLKEIIEDELKEFSEELQFLVKNPITVWDPEHGEIQADIPLPLAVKTLKEMPDFSPLVEKAAHYLPDKSTWDKMVKTVSDVLPLEDAKEGNETKVGIKQNQPIRRYGVKGRNFKVRLIGQ